MWNNKTLWDELYRAGKVLIIDYSEYFNKTFLEKGRRFRSLSGKWYEFDGNKFVDMKKKC